MLLSTETEAKLENQCLDLTAVGLDLPGEAWLDLTGDGGVLKSILTPGDSSCGPPPVASTIRVHYIGRFTDGTEFDNSYKRNSPLTFRLGQEMVLKGWDVVVGTMYVGEKCIARMTASYAYGEEGSTLGDTTLIPPSTLVVFEMELINFEKPIDTILDRITAATNKKDEGNQYFKEGKYKDAIKSYDQALYFFEHVFPKSDSEDFELVNQCKLPIFLNQAACHIKEQNWSDARICCEKSLDIDENNVKAIFRRGQAFQGAGNYQKARQDFELAVTRDPNSAELKKALGNLQRLEVVYKAKEKDVYAKMFTK